MTKFEVATVLRQRTGLTQKQAMELVELFLGSVKAALMEGRKVSLVGFGTFSLKVKPARPGRNPRTGESIQIAEKSVVTFKPGKEFREMVEEPVNMGNPMARDTITLAAKSAHGHGEDHNQNSSGHSNL